MSAERHLPLTIIVGYIVMIDLVAHVSASINNLAPLRTGDTIISFHTLVTEMKHCILWLSLLSLISTTPGGFLSKLLGALSFLTIHPR